MQSGSSGKQAILGMARRPLSLASLTLRIGFVLIAGAWILEFSFMQIHVAAVAVGVLYMVMNLYFLSNLFQRASSSRHIRILMSVGVLVKLPVLFFLLYILSKVGKEYVLGGLVGMFSFIPASIFFVFQDEEMSAR